MHEDFSRRHDVKSPSERAFGLVMMIAFGVFSVAPVRHGLPLRSWAVGMSAGFALLAVAAPRLLRPLNVVWMRFGVVLHRITSPLVLAVVYYGVVMPTGLVMRACGRDPLRRHRNTAAASYWIPRVPPGPSPGSMTEQF